MEGAIVEAPLKARRSSGQGSANVSLFESVISVRRVNKVVSGGRRLAFSAFVVVGDGLGRVGLGSGKAREVSLAISKATRRAAKKMMVVPLKGNTIPYGVSTKFGASKLMLSPARPGTGIIAGGSVRQIMMALGIKDVFGKSFGSSNPITSAMVALKALKMLKEPKDFATLRGVKFSGSDFAEVEGGL